MSAEKYYSTGQDLTISIVEIKASSMAEAEAVLQKFIDEIAKVMPEAVRWDEADWSIEENTFNEAEGVWEVTDEGFRPSFYLDENGNTIPTFLPLDENGNPIEGVE